MPKLPFMQFYPADWIQDTQVLNQSAKGSWIDLLCQMWLAPERGVLDWCLDEFTTLLRLQNDNETSQMVSYLQRVADITLYDSERNEVNYVENATHIKLINRRIVRDAKRIKDKQLADLKYNEKRTKIKRSKNDRKTTPIYQKSEVRNHIKKEEESEKLKTASPAVEGFKESMAIYHDSFVAKFGAKPDIDGGRDGKLLSGLLKEHGAKEVQSLLRDFFDNPPPWVEKNCSFTLPIFKRFYNDLIARRKTINREAQIG